LEGGCPAPAEACPQTGDGGAMSYSRLVFDGDNTQAATEEFLDQVVLFDIHGGAPQGGDSGCVVDRLAVGGSLDEGLVPSGLDPLRDPVHGPVERTVFPVVRIWGAVANRGDAVGVDHVLVGRGSLGTERALVDRRLGVSLDVDDLLVLDVDE